MVHSTLGTCKRCRRSLTAYDLDRGPGLDGECARCAHEIHEQDAYDLDEESSLSSQLLTGLAQAGRLRRAV